MIFVDASIKDKTYISIKNNEEEIVIAINKKLTHIEAEYLAVLLAYILFGYKTILSDNEFVVKHINNEYKTKKEIFNRIKECIKTNVMWIEREKNKADKVLRRCKDV
ncbi:MAG: hypothetical protein RMI01_09305 [Thermodesulfovibrio sp.]|nr:hypothetical protein [Thermodesulfovibrio sp.]